MKKWKYLKGSAADFVGSHAVATHCARHIEKGHSVFTDRPAVINLDLFEFTAQRQLVDDDEQDLNECIGQHQCSVSEMKLRPASEIDIPDFLLDVYRQNKFPCKKVDVVISDSTEALITERGNRYGKFKDGAEIMRDLKHVMHEVDGWNNLSPSQKEALDMIQHKIGRILNGDPNYDDNWKDVAGYATLIVNELNGEIK